MISILQHAVSDDRQTAKVLSGHCCGVASLMASRVFGFMHRALKLPFVLLSPLSHSGPSQHIPDNQTSPLARGTVSNHQKKAIFKRDGEAHGCLDKQRPLEALATTLLHTRTQIQWRRPSLFGTSLLNDQSRVENAAQEKYYLLFAIMSLQTTGNRKQSARARGLRVRQAPSAGSLPRSPVARRSRLPCTSCLPVGGLAGLAGL